MTIYDRPKAFAQNPNRRQARFWLSEAEIEFLNEYRQRHGGKITRISDRKRNDVRYQNATLWGERRRDLIEGMKFAGQSLRTKKARKDLNLTSSVMVEGDDGIMTAEMYAALFPDEN